jgi:pilus assembly protein CpaB
MRTRIVILIVALALGVLAAVMAAQYLNDARTKVAAESEPIEVLVAQSDVPRGVTSEELVAQDLVKLEEVPRRFVAADAVSSPRAIEGQVLATPLSSGQQVTAASFQVPSTAGVSFSINADQQAVAIPVDEVRGVSGLVKPGDRVAVYVTVSPGPAGEPDYTKQLLAEAKVVAVGASLQSDSQSEEEEQGSGIAAAQGRGTEDGRAARTLTLAISPADVERVVFAAETGDVYVSLLPANAEDQPVGKGQTLKTVFR